MNSQTSVALVWGIATIFILLFLVLLPSVAGAYASHDNVDREGIQKMKGQIADRNSECNYFLLKVCWKADFNASSYDTPW